MYTSTTIRSRTVKLLKRLMDPLVDEGIITNPESREIVAHLKYLADKGQPMPLVAPRLINQKEAAEMLGIGLSNFKKQEHDGAFPFKRKMVGSAVRYRNLDLLEYILVD